MLKLIPGILTIGLLATGCSRSTGSELSAAAAPQHQKMATPTSEPGSRPVAGTAPRPTAAHARSDRLGSNLAPRPRHELQWHLSTANSRCRSAPHCRWS